MDAPENRDPLRQEEIGYLRGETTVIHPADHQFRLQAAHQSNQSPQSPQRGPGWLYPRGMHRDPQGFNPFAQRAAIDEGDYNRFKAQLERIPRDALPEDKRFNPLAMNPYVLFKALPQARRYSMAELIRAMDLLLQCNQRLVFSTQDEAMVMQQTLVQIVGATSEQPGRR